MWNKFHRAVLDNDAQTVQKAMTCKCPDPLETKYCFGTACALGNIEVVKVMTDILKNNIGSHTSFETNDFVKWLHDGLYDACASRVDEMCQVVIVGHLCGLLNESLSKCLKQDEFTTNLENITFYYNFIFRVACNNGCLRIVKCFWRANRKLNLLQIDYIAAHRESTHINMQKFLKRILERTHRTDKKLQILVKYIQPNKHASEFVLHALTF